MEASTLPVMGTDPKPLEVGSTPRYVARRAEKLFELARRVLGSLHRRGPE